MNMSFRQTGSSFEYDVLVIGSGMAGLHYCLQLLKRNPRLNIALLCKAEANECNSRYAQGGIAAVTLPEDSMASHIEDTLKAGAGLCYEPTVREMVEQGPECIRQLEQYQVPFSKEDQGDYLLAQEGGHSQRRILNCGDKTGFSIIESMLRLVRENPQIHVFEDHIAVNLICHYVPHNIQTQGEVLGAYVLDCRQNRIHTILASAVVLATGGSGKIYRYTSNPMIATGDGVAMAYRAGARVGNMEFYQFHPTLLYHPLLNNFLISEAVRGEGALLLNADSKQRFMSEYAAEQMELATRDIVSRAIFNEIEQSDKSFVYLDIRHKSKAFLQKRFPSIYETLASVGIDMSQDLIPVVPAAHYQCGGVLSDAAGRTDLKRLYAIGEVAFSGMHGANRLASNSLLEALVMASKAASVSLSDLASPPKLKDPVPSWDAQGLVNPRRASQINAHWRSIRGEMTSYAGIVRTEAGLQDLLQLIHKRKKIIEEYYWKHCITRDFLELRNIILVAEVIVLAALNRRESRGGHYREDFPTSKTVALESIERLNSPSNPFI